MADTAGHLVERVLPKVPVRQWVLTLPFPLRLRWVVTMLGQLLETSPDLVIAFLAQRPHVVRRPETELERKAARHYEEYHQEVVAFVEQGMAEGVLRQNAAGDFALLFMGLLQAFTYRWVTSMDDFDVPANTNRMLELFLRGAGDPGFKGTV